MVDLATSWAKSTSDPENALEMFNSELDAGDMSQLDSALDDFSFDFNPPMPKELIAIRLSKWAGKAIPVTNPLVQNSTIYKDLVLDMDYPDDMDNQKKSKMKQFYLLLKNSVSPAIVDEITSVFKNILAMADKHKVKSVYLVKNDDIKVIIVLADDTFVISNDDESRGYDIDGRETGLSMKDLSNWKSMPKKVCRNPSAVIGEKLYKLLNGDNGNIGLWSLPYNG